MARQTYFTSVTKRPRSLRQILAELFSGRVMSRLDELETTVRLLNERLDNQASVVANVGAIVASGSSREAKNARPLVKEKNNKDSSNGKFSKKEAETNGLRSHYSFTGDGSRSSRSEPFDAGFIHHHTFVDDNYHHSSGASCHSGWDGGGCDTSTSSSYSGSCCD
ncbi:TPA: hypothetical protein RXT57_003220 [Escherichia coli]|jgi:hypothetical protein|uniref:hypothetical protein n=1 Tax=Escherichia coli TaxID=562 RepID=UPI00174F8E75|nr:hypothetical protein [Escherichia coli]HAN2594968.1 hypothetical protein [Escherichia coli O25b:H4-ST131]HAH1697865.1 hypothetical protein [Escherichia coli]HAH3950198.1 hypothetical protein [Escherichia coli]HAJ3315611.1 hypothetical protein [Escherichia coli]